MELCSIIKIYQVSVNTSLFLECMKVVHFTMGKRFNFWQNPGWTLFSGYILYFQIFLVWCIYFKMAVLYLIVNYKHCSCICLKWSYWNLVLRYWRHRYNPFLFISTHLFLFQGFGKMLVIMCILSGVNIFAWLNKPQPAWWSWCLENKLYACMMMFFLANMIEGQLVSSGAFEISLDNIPLWSKLETGRIPQPPELFQIIDNTLQFSKMDIPNSNFGQ